MQSNNYPLLIGRRTKNINYKAYGIQSKNNIYFLASQKDRDLLSDLRIRLYNNQMSFEKQAELIREERDKHLSQHLRDIIKFVEKIPKDKIDKIINSTATELAAMLNKNDTTSVELVNIFAYRSGTIGHQLIAMTQDNFTQALKMAKECDARRKSSSWKNSQTLEESKPHFSPLYGVPISIKDTVDMKGFASTIGCVSRYSVKKQKDGQIITVLKNAGMIPFIRTNVPQICLNYECNNLIWGKTQNPWNRQRTPGGSSGGEAALIASKCSAIGLGGDIAGSLRIPAEFCGIYTLKSTSQRITAGGHTTFSPSVDGQINIKPTMGPLARCVEDLSAFLSIIMDESNYSNQILDAYKKLQSFDSKTYKGIFSKNGEKYRIGYYDSFELFPSTKASNRAVHQVIDILKSKGHTIIPVKIPGVQQITKLLVSMLVAEGNLQGYQQILQGEPLAKQYKPLQIALNLPKSLHWILCRVLQRVSPRMAFTLQQCKQLSTHEYLCLSGRQKQLRQDFLRMWKADHLDFIIGPGMGTQAPIISQSYKMSVLPTMYTNIWNVLDMTVGSLPVTTVRIDQQKYQSDYEDIFAKSTRSNMIGTEGLPVGVQVISLPFHDEQVLGLMKVIEEEVKFREKYSYPM